jgi:hypothetical protein
MMPDLQLPGAQSLLADAWETVVGGTSKLAAKIDKLLMWFPSADAAAA